MASIVPLIPPGRHCGPRTLPINDIRESVGLIVVVHVTDVGGPLIVRIEGFDVGSETVWEILTSDPIVVPGTTVLRVRPGISEVPNRAAADMLPVSLQVTFDHAAESTYSATAYLTN